MSELTERAFQYQSMRVARDDLDGTWMPEYGMWWIIPHIAQERGELERAKQAHQQSDQDAFAPKPW